MSWSRMLSDPLPGRSAKATRSLEERSTSVTIADLFPFQGSTASTGTPRRNAAARHHRQAWPALAAASSSVPFSGRGTDDSDVSRDDSEPTPCCPCSGTAQDHERSIEDSPEPATGQQ